MGVRRRLSVVLAGLAIGMAAFVAVMGLGHLVGPAYSVVKATIPEAGSTVLPGDVITSVVTVTHRGGDGVSDALFIDDLSTVREVTWSGDLEVSDGVAAINDGVLVWGGDVGAGEQITVRYALIVGGESGVTVLDEQPLVPDADPPRAVRALLAALALLGVAWWLYRAARRADNVAGSRAVSGGWRLNHHAVHG
ncbi:hypothetical protein G1H11_12150 [Phytoactinopolyspora alkaliphila]|uniref:DUF7927 domain-containing protein n=1 Tax=Phytoactinopolyspora alkaliphila TaxID=1783498 RepID=A0A6N9YMB1_9ACTN|nr:hypothetical protein [Phytoactinopolyspora alkaliphila]NED96060.1 hypothetical protein [Phytoactinopolyspora alkaliphila]